MSHLRCVMKPPFSAVRAGRDRWYHIGAAEANHLDEPFHRCIRVRARSGMPEPPDGRCAQPCVEIRSRKARARSRAPSGSPATRRATSALPTITPSANPHAAAAWSGVPMPTPTSRGVSVSGRSRCDQLARGRGQLGPGPRHAVRGHAVHEPAAGGGDGRQALRRRAGRRQEHGLEAVRGRPLDPLPGLVDRQVGHDGGGDAGLARLREEGVDPVASDRVHVRHDGDGDVERPPSRSSPGRRGRARRPRAPGRRPPGSRRRPSPGPRTGCRPRSRRRRRPASPRSSPASTPGRPPVT